MDFKANLIMKLIRFGSYQKSKIKEPKKSLLKLTCQDRWDILNISFGTKFIF